MPSDQMPSWKKEIVIKHQQTAHDDAALARLYLENGDLALAIVHQRGAAMQARFARRAMGME